MASLRFSSSAARAAEIASKSEDCAAPGLCDTPSLESLGRFGVEVVDPSGEEVCGVSLLAAVAAARCMNCTILGQLRGNL